MGKNDINDLWQWIEDEQLPPVVLRILMSVSQAICEHGYDKLTEIILSDKSGLLSPHTLQQPDCAILPAPLGGPEYCSQNLLAIARGGRGKSGLTQVLRSVRSYLIHCVDNGSICSTKNVVIFTDVLNNRTFWESRSDFRSHQLTNGVQCYFFYWDGKIVRRFFP